MPEEIKKPSWIPDHDIYIVVTERDFNTDQSHEPYPIVLERRELPNSFLWSDL